jgi:hypothetical protein
MALITYATKATGDTFTAADANEIKTVVNTNAFNGANTATGTTSVTINAKSGVATFIEPCAIAPDFTTYVINNSLINPGAIVSKVSVNVQSDYDGAFCSLVSVTCVTGAIRISVNDGFSTNPTNPIISFQILA